MLEAPDIKCNTILRVHEKPVIFRRFDSHLIQSKQDSTAHWIVLGSPRFDSGRTVSGDLPVAHHTYMPMTVQLTSQMAPENLKPFLLGIRLRALTLPRPLAAMQDS